MLGMMAFGTKPVSELSDDQLYGLFLRIRNHESAKSIGQYIQKAWGVNPKSTVHSISQGVLKFKKRIAHLILSPSPTDEHIPGEFEYDKIERMGSLEEMERIAELQRARIQLMMEEERRLGVKHGTMSRNLQALATLTKVNMSLKEFKILHESDDPIILRRLKRKKQALQRRWDRTLTRVMPTKEDREKVIEATNRFIEMIDERSVKLESVTSVDK